MACTRRLINLSYRKLFWANWKKGDNEPTKYRITGEYLTTSSGRSGVGINVGALTLVDVERPISRYYWDMEFHREDQVLEYIRNFCVKDLCVQCGDAQICSGFNVKWLGK